MAEQSFDGKLGHGSHTEGLMYVRAGTRNRILTLHGLNIMT